MMAAPPLALVTGASGYIASHIVQQLLLRGDTRVRGTVRKLSNERKVTPLREMVPEATYPLELMEAELTDPESWKEAVKGCTYVYHVASPIPVAVPREESVLVRPAVDGAVNVLTACAESGTVKRVVLTSSLGAVSIGMYGEMGREYTEEDWSPEDQSPPYEKSKLLAERRAWEFVEKLDEGKKFELATILPGTAIGPFANSAADPISVQVVQSVIGGQTPALIHLYLTMVDVRDLAAAHIAAMETPTAAGKRFIVCKSPGMWMRELSEVIAGEFGSQGYKIPSWHIPKPGLWLAKFFSPVMARVYPALGKQFTYRTDRMREVLEIEHRNIENSIIDTCYDLIERGLVPRSNSYRGRERNTIKTESQKEQILPANQQDKEEEGDMVNIKQQKMEEETSLAKMIKPEQREVSKEEHQTTHESEEEGNNAAEPEHLGHSVRRLEEEGDGEKADESSIKG